VHTRAHFADADAARLAAALDPGDGLEEVRQSLGEDGVLLLVHAPDCVGRCVQRLRVGGRSLRLDGFLERLENEDADVLDVLGRPGVAHGVVLGGPGCFRLGLALGLEVHLGREIGVPGIALHYCVGQGPGGLIHLVKSLLRSSRSWNGCTIEHNQSMTTRSLAIVSTSQDTRLSTIRSEQEYLLSIR
jgi:hypothetical protein